MGSPAARIGDSISHGGSITEGSTDVLTNGAGQARVGDAVTCTLHGAQTITDGSSTVFVNGRKAARVGDPISCGAVIISGSADVSIG
jgi:uncharacterized Zn-binding protein involved in type VI secretion